jgi:hypothetical protein
MSLPPPSDTRAAVNGVALQVTPDNVLRARDALLAEAESFHDFLTTTFVDRRDLIGLCGGDPISQQAQRAFSQKIQQNAVAPARQYIQELTKGAEELAEVARGFGFTERQIADSFTSSSGAADVR